MQFVAGKNRRHTTESPDPFPLRPQREVPRKAELPSPLCNILSCKNYAFSINAFRDNFNFPFFGSTAINFTSIISPSLIPVSSMVSNRR